MMDDAGAIGGPGGPRPLEWEAMVASVQDLAAASGAEVAARLGTGLRPQGLRRQG